uniref:ATP-binding protein n=1 Tax=Halovivax sp. TaxID=1935978 RepID=UPI0037446129
DAAEAVADAERTLERIEGELVAALSAWSAAPDLAVGESARVAAAAAAFVERGAELREHRDAARERDELRRRLLERLSTPSVSAAFEPYRSTREGEAGESGGVPRSAGGGGGSEAAGSAEGGVGSEAAGSAEGGVGSEAAGSAGGGAIDETVAAGRVTDGEEATDRDDDEWLLEAYERILDELGDPAAVDDRLAAVAAEREELEGQREGLVERRVELDRELAELASDADVREAHAQIEAGRKRLEPLAERYATARIAERLLDELHDRFVERTTGPLLDEAGQILERITGGTYAGIEVDDDREELDFLARLGDGSIQRTGELSRATAEQLFLAVRLARIRRHDVALPVLLDDSLTNFDPGHAERTLEAVAELADGCQVFVLTCHPAMLDRIEPRVDADYWYLEDGRFDGPYESADPARALLTGEDGRGSRSPGWTGGGGR